VWRYQSDPPVVSTHFNDEVVVCELSGEMSSTKEQGYFAADTRLVSGYRLKLGGEQPILLNGAAVWQHSARFEFTNPPSSAATATSFPNTLSTYASIGASVLRSTRTTTSPTRPRRCRARPRMSIESDFADLFDVKGAPARQTRLHPQLVGRREPTAHHRYANSPFERSLSSSSQ